MWLFGREVSLTRPVLQSVSSLSESGVSLTRPALKSVSSFVGRGMSLKHPELVCLVFGSCEFLLHTAWWNLFRRSALEEFL